MSPASRSVFDTFEHHIDLEQPFGLRLRIEAEGPEQERGVICLLPNTEGPPLHLHTNQDEEFSVLSGSLWLRVGPSESTLKGAGSVRFPRNTPHTYANRSPDVCVFRYTLTPGHDFTGMMRRFADLAQQGKLTRLGDFGTMIHLAAVIAEFEGHVRSVSPPHTVMRLLGSLSRFLR